MARDSLCTAGRELAWAATLFSLVVCLLILQIQCFSDMTSHGRLSSALNNLTGLEGYVQIFPCFSF